MALDGLLPEEAAMTRKIQDAVQDAGRLALMCLMVVVAYAAAPFLLGGGRH